ncbi:hypothetical protein [Bradyrhizobium sp. RDI18]
MLLLLRPFHIGDDVAARDFVTSAAEQPRLFSATPAFGSHRALRQIAEF